MTIAKRAAWLCAGAIALAPQAASASTAHARLTVGVTVITPCRIDARVDAVSCMGRPARVTKGNGAIDAGGVVGTAGTAGSYAKFVEVAF